MRNNHLNIFILSLLVLLGLTMTVLAAPASEIYQIDHDSLNFVGGSISSTNYAVSGTGGEVGTGHLSSETYVIDAGFQAMQSSNLVVGFTGDPNLSPGIVLPAGGRSDGVVSWVVSSDTGYTLTVKDNFNSSDDGSLLNSNFDQILPYFPQSRVITREEGDPPGQSYVTKLVTYTGNEDRQFMGTAFGLDSFTDGRTPDYNWTIANNDSRIGFSATGTDVATAYRNDGASCGVADGAISVAYCWDSFRYIPSDFPCNDIDCSNMNYNTPLDNQYTQRTIASKNSSVSNSTTTLDLRVEVGSNANQPQGVYKMMLSATVNAN